MSWLDKLKALINIEFNKPLINITLCNNSNNTRATNGYYYDEPQNRLIIDTSRLDEGKRKELKPILQAYIAEENKLLETNTSKLLDCLYNYNKENKNSQILQFFKPIIPPNDLDALEASLFLRDAFKRGENIDYMKHDIRMKFGDRGSNIANLCTPGYFETFLMPLYNTSPERFKELYEIIISNAALAVFVHREKSAKEITDEIIEKIVVSKRYGIKFLHIHGIGKHNIGKIKKCIEENKMLFKFFEKNIIDKDNILIIELLLE